MSVAMFLAAFFLSWPHAATARNALASNFFRREDWFLCFRLFDQKKRQSGQNLRSGPCSHG